MITKNTIVSGVICGVICVAFMAVYMNFAMGGPNKMSSGGANMSMGMDHKMDEAMSDSGSSMGAMMSHMDDNLKGKSGSELEKVFLQDMIVHHQGAVDMANELLKDKTVRPELVKFANDIITAQTAEITMQKKWLKDWYGITR